ncbi:MAG: hypothetical protein CL623_06005 [Arcobacter sp.]|nr:hypothetical protein [Arcobacter sp.]
MKKRLNKFRESNSINNILLLIFLFLALVFTSYYYFNSYKEKILINAKDNYQLNINYLNSKVHNNILKSDKNIIELEVNKVLESTLFDLIEIEHDRFIFSKEKLINTTPNFDDKSWAIAEIVIDARYGFIKKIDKTSLYEFMASSNYEKSQPINIRYQVYKKNEIKNFITKLDFSNIKLEKENKDDSFSWIDSLITIDIANKIEDIVIDNINIATISYSLNSKKVKAELQSFLIHIIIFNLIIYLPILFMLGFYHKFIFRKYVTKPVLYINNYLDDILDNKFAALDKSQFEGTKEIKELTTKVSKVSSKIATLKNEINVNKDSLEKKTYSDTLTGLPNKYIFDFDIKSMFVTSTSAYVFILRIDSLVELSKKYDSGYINNFIETYSNIIKNIIFNINKTNLKMYRFYGSEFAIVAKDMNFEESQQMCEAIIKEISDRIPFIYDVPDDLIHIGGTSFDLYGSLESVLASANSAYKVSKEKGISSYYIISEKDIEKDYTSINNNVIEVITKAEFEIDLVLDTYLFDNPDILVMNEVSPQLYDHNNEKLSIGSFIAVSQKLKLADKFDKLVIEKTINLIKEKQINHELSINLSISSVENSEFMIWLRDILEENEAIKKYIVFSITSYSAYLHRKSFEKFVSDVHNMGAKILIKRYKTDEYPLNKLEEVKLDYIRMDKDYTNNFTNDVVKKHKVKNIVIFGELNSIKIMADSVKLESDYDLLERFGTYATTR